MSLRVKLNLLITGLFITVLAGASGYVIHNAREAVSDEMQSTAHLTLQLLGVAVDSERAGLHQEFLDRLSTLESTRHLSIAVLRGHNPRDTVPPQVPMQVHAQAPDWFVRVVQPPALEYRRIYAGPGVPYTEILIQADPSDEITEVWHDTRAVLIILLIFVLLANVLVYFTLGRDLAPIESILKGLERIEQGDYRLRLPRFRLTELTRISEKFNHMAEVLLRSREENRMLTQRSLVIQEEERRRLSRELHDELGQSLSAIKALAVAVIRALDRDRAAVKENVESIARISDHTYGVARNMIQRLRPSVLDELGLRTALQTLVDEWNARQADTFCQLNVTANLDGLDDEMNINLYRIVQESLTNVARHSGAARVAVGISGRGARTDAQLHIVIRDNGRGFDAEQRHQAK